MKRITIGNLPLPEELARDIFLRLPVKILCGCKVVCKQWCAFIESPSFVNQHFCESKERLLLRVGIFVDPAPAPVQEVFNAIVVDVDPEFDDPELAELEALVPPSPEPLDPRPYLVGCKYALSVDETLSEFEEPFHLQMPESVHDILGPFNGVFCLVSNMWPYGPSALLNLETRQFKPLPLVELVELPDRSLFGDGLGIGLDPLTGDYKLVLLMYFLCSYHDQFDYQCVVSVCSSDSDSWRRIEDVDPNVSHSSRSVSDGSLCNTYLNGVYYWLLEFFDTLDVAILAFDMRTEKLKETQVMGPVAQSKSGKLALRGNSLVLLMYDSIDRCIDLWMMLDEGCWIKSSRVGPLEGITCPLYFWKNDELLFEAEAEAEAEADAEAEENTFLNSYNVSTQKLRDLKVMSEGNSFLRWVFIYKESLVSLKGKSGKCKLWDTSSDYIKDFFN